MEGQVIELAYALDTFYFLVMGAFVMWMAAGFSMLEAGLVRGKSTVEILTFEAGVIQVSILEPTIFLSLSIRLTAIETILPFKSSLLDIHLSIFLLDI